MFQKQNVLPNTYTTFLPSLKVQVIAITLVNITNNIVDYQ